MRPRYGLATGVLRWIVLLLCLAAARPALAQVPDGLGTLRAQYDAVLADFEALAAARGDAETMAQARKGREAMRDLTDEQLTAVYAQTRVPDLSVAALASHYLVARAESLALTAAFPTPQSPGLPGPVAIPSGCSGVDIGAETRYALLITKEVTNAILSAAAFVCTQDILGTNGAAVCIPFAIAAAIANGFFDTATFCAGEVTANQVDANFGRLDHLHGDLAGAITTIVNNSNTNTTTIINNANANTTAIVANDNTNTATIITDANANKNELRDLILRTQIEADLAMVDGAAVAVLYAVPTPQGGYLDLVTAIVTETISNIQAAGAGVGNAGAMLDGANAAKASGDFQTAYALYRRAYKAAGK